MRLTPWNDPILVSRAHRELAKARRRGDVVSGPCEKCGKTEKVEAHHEDYSKPLEVAWLCRVHHKSRHAEINRAFKLENGHTQPKPRNWDKHNKVAAALAHAGELSVELVAKATGLNTNEVGNVLTLWRRDGKVRRQNRGVFMYRLTLP